MDVSKENLELVVSAFITVWGHNNYSDANSDLLWMLPE